MPDVCRTETVEGLTVQLFYDTDSESPRCWDYASRFICWHRRYSLGDKHGFDSPDDFQEWWTAYGVGGVLIPLYLYDHGGITISTSAFSCRWDSGQVGWACITADKLAAEFHDSTLEDRISKGRELIKAEVDTYDTYLRGEVYGFKVIDEDGDEVDSCWGIFGEDVALAEATECARIHAARRGIQLPLPATPTDGGPAHA